MNRNYTLWIEAECWAPGWWNPADDNTDVIVTFENGERWVATFFSYQNIISLREKNRETGECLSGKYFCATDLILIDEVSRKAIEEVTADLIAEEEFTRYFTRCSDEEEE